MPRADSYDGFSKQPSFVRDTQHFVLLASLWIQRGDVARPTRPPQARDSVFSGAHRRALASRSPLCLTPRVRHARRARTSGATAACHSAPRSSRPWLVATPRPRRTTCIPITRMRARTRGRRRPFVRTPAGATQARRSSPVRYPSSPVRWQPRRPLLVWPARPPGPPGSLCPLRLAPARGHQGRYR
jgi:hypothetical protein